LNKDTELRDAMRERDAGEIAGAVWSVIGEALEGAMVQEAAAGEMKGTKAREIAEMAIKVAGAYVCASKFLTVSLSPSSTARRAV
jgi:exportin-T